MIEIWRTSFCGARRIQETSSHRNMGIIKIVYSWLWHCWFWKFLFNRLLSSWLTTVLVAWFHSVFQLWCYFASSPISPSIPQLLFCETTNQARPEFSKAGETRWLVGTCHHSKQSAVFTWQKKEPSLQYSKAAWYSTKDKVYHLVHWNYKHFKRELIIIKTEDWNCTLLFLIGSLTLVVLIR